MKIDEYSGKDDIRVLAGMIISRVLLSHVSGVWIREGLLSSPTTNIIGGLCVDYFKKHDKAPRKGIATLVRDWAVGKDDEVVQLVDSVASGILENYNHWKEKINVSYEVDYISKYTTIVKAKKLIKDLEGAIDLGRVDKILEYHKSFSAVDIGKDKIIDIVRDRGLITQAFSEKQNPLIEYGSSKLRALGQFLGDAFSPGHFIGIAAPEKRGKTSVLLEFGWVAQLQKRKVLFIEAGDMTAPQLAMRIYSRTAMKPVRARQWPLTIKLPRSIKIKKHERFVDYEEREFKSSLTEEETVIAMENVAKNKIKSATPYFKLICAPAGTITVSYIKNLCEGLIVKDDWVPEIIVIDYADLLITHGSGDFREKTDRIWTELKALTNELNCCVITATQANRASYDAPTITMKHISEDKRKGAHVNGFMGISQLPEEKKAGIFRFNWMNTRNSDLDDMTCVYVAGCLHVSKPMMVSCWPEKEET